MKTEIRVRDLSIRLVQILVLFEILWAAVFVTGLTFDWSGLTSQLQSMFFGAGFCSLVLIVVLAALNVTANLNIISTSLAESHEPLVRNQNKRQSYWPVVLVAGILIIVVVGSLALAEARLYRAKRLEAESKIESVADTSLLTNALTAIKRDANAIELRKIRDALATAMQSGDRMSLLIPRETNGVKTYYEFSGWWWGGSESQKISALPLPRFVPTLNEADDFKNLVSGKIDKFSLKAGSEVRSFRRILKPEGEIIILIDTNRQYGDRKFSS